MACVYTLRLPIRVGVTSGEILAALAQWINLNPCNSFRDFFFADLSSPMEVSCPEAQLSAACASINEITYTAVRLESRSALSPALSAPENMGLQADFLIEEGVQSCFFTLQVHCSLLDPHQPAVLPQIAPPEVVWYLAEQGLLEADGGLPLQQSPINLTPALDKTLHLHRSGAVFSALPMLFVREGNYILTPKLASRLCQFAHVFLLPGIHPALSGLGAGGVRLFFPRLGISRAVDLTAPSACEDLVAYISRLTDLAIPGDLPTLPQLQALCHRQTQRTADYLCMNRRLADSIRFYRLKNGLTQSELAQKAGTTGLLISRLENNRPSRVRESLIADIEEALHLTNRELFACEGVSVQPETAAARPAFCPICGTKTTENGQFCCNCGSKFA